MALPHTQLTKAYLCCAYTQKIIKLCKMLHTEGISVTVYAGEENDTPAKLAVCVTKQTQKIYGHGSPEQYNTFAWDRDTPLWKVFHKNAILALKNRVKPGDIIGTFSGLCDEEIMRAFPQCRFVELGIGYDGIIPDSFHVFESAAWMNTVYGRKYGASNANGRFYDTVIPNYFEPDDFPFAEKQGDYVLYVGRMIGRKGLAIINDVAKRMQNTKFILAGPGARVDGSTIIYDEYKNADGKWCTATLEGDNLQYIGVIDGKQRGKLMSEARALICPTLYIPPFEGVHVEAMMCGTPVVTPPYGAFAETYINGVHGYKCRTIRQFSDGIERADKLDRRAIRKYARGKYSAEVVVKQYLEYFDLLDGLNRGGFNG